jgi:soluble lytic murein transglycosylase-like protein
MPLPRRAVLALGIAAALGACAAPKTETLSFADGLDRGDTPEMRRLVQKFAAEYQMPPSLIHRVIRRESGYNPGARNGPYWGLMQIMPQTAATMGHRGPPSDLLDAETNLRYAGRYLRGAWLVADGSQDRAMMWYSKGYYYEAKRRGMLVETGLRG